MSNFVGLHDIAAAVGLVEITVTRRVLVTVYTSANEYPVVRNVKLVYTYTQLYSPNTWQIENRNINKKNQHK